jgi:hypothetical protein
MAALVAVVVVAGACSRSSNKSSATNGPATTAVASATTAAAAANPCTGATLQATDVGITPTTITVEVMADVGSPLAPGLFQGSIDAVNAFANYINGSGGIACRKLVVRSWDSKLDPAESKNGLIDACSNAFAMVGNNALFNPDISPMTGCVDKTSKPTGLPDVAALAVDVHEECGPTTFVVQNNLEQCQTTTGPRQQNAMIGPTKWYLQKFGPLHGVFLVPGDLPTTVQSSISNIDAQAQAGVTWDATPKVSGADAQPAYTPRVQVAKAKASDYVYDGSNDVAMVRMRSEAAAQGLSSVKLWACSLACYTKLFLTQGGANVEGTYLWIQYLPIEEASYNAAEAAYVKAIGDKEISWAAQAWQAALAFKQAADTIVKQSGPNALTRASLMTTLSGMTDFTADGWIGKKSLHGSGTYSPCFVIMQVQNGKFVRVYPTQPGTMDCNPSNIATPTVDPVAEAAKLK